MRRAQHLLVYLLLACGSLVFVWPFLWMAATSAKLDREMFADQLGVWPQRPIPRLHSPYLDDRLFADVRGSRQTFKTTFPVERLHRLQLALRYDDTWHAIMLYVEENGRRLHASRELEASDYEWVTDTWQEPGPDDRPTKIRTWTLLEPMPGNRPRLRLQGLTRLRLHLN